MKTAHILFTASLAFAMAFTLSCSSNDDDPPAGGELSGNPEYEYMKERYKYYDPNEEGYRCQNGVVERACKLSSGDVWYNPLQQRCEEVDYDRTTYTLIFELGDLAVCGKYLYANVPNGWGKCQGGVYQQRCNNEWYNYDTHFCDEEYVDGGYIDVLKAMELCGGKYYAPDEGYRRCQNNVVEQLCGSRGESNLWYNRETHFCDWNDYTLKPVVSCGNEKIRYSEERCNNEVVEEKCGNGWYNPIKQSCNWGFGTVTDKVKCGN